MGSSAVEFIIDSDFDDDVSESRQCQAQSDGAPSSEPSLAPTSRRRPSHEKHPRPVSHAKRHMASGNALRHSGRLADPGYKSFACNKCDESFNFNFELLRHKMLHYETPKRSPLPSAAARWKVKSQKLRLLKNASALKSKPNLKNAKKEFSARLDDPELLTPLDRGWTRLVVYRSNSVQNACDVYYISPLGRKFRSPCELANEKFEDGLSLDHFRFTRKPLDLKHPREIVRKALSNLQPVKHSPVGRMKKEVSETKIISPSHVPSKNAPPPNGRRTVKTSKNVSKGSVGKGEIPKTKTTSPTKPHSRNMSSESEAFSKFKRSPIATRRFRNMKLSDFVQIPLKASVSRHQPGTHSKGNNSPNTTRKSDADKSKASKLVKTPAITKKAGISKMKNGLVDEQYLPPLNQGWSRLVVFRRKGKYNCDVYYFDPSGKKFRSMKELEKETFNGKQRKGLSTENFTFAKRPLNLDHSKQIIQNSGNRPRGRMELKKDERTSPVRPLRPLTCLLPKIRSPVKRRVRTTSDPKLDFLSQLELDSKHLQPRVLLEDIMLKKSSKIASLTASEEPVNGCCDTQSADGDDVASPSRSNLPSEEGNEELPAVSGPDQNDESEEEALVETEATSLLDHQTENKSSGLEAEEVAKPFSQSVAEAASSSDVSDSESHEEPKTPFTQCDVETDNESISNEDMGDESLWVSQAHPENELIKSLDPTTYVVDLEEEEVWRHVCKHCLLEFDTVHDLFSHYRDHVAEGWILDKKPPKAAPVVFRCYHCDFSTESRVELMAHMTKHTRKLKSHPYECRTCGYRGRKLADIERHRLTHSNHKPYECHECGHKSKIKSALGRHIRIVHLKLKPFACSQCGFRAADKSRLKTHLALKHSKWRYHCAQCNFSAASFDAVRRHEVVHGKKRFACEQCRYSTNYRSDLRIHMTVHTGWKPFQCSFCEYKCCNAKYLKIHMRVHTGEKPFKCEVCQSTFAHRSTLRKHVDGHYRVLKYQCTFCPYKTLYQGTLQRHEKLHLGELPHECPHCPKRFVDLVGLNSHMRSHTGETPYECAVCKRKFGVRATWKYHLRKCDPGNPALQVRRKFIQPLPKKEASKAIMAAVATAKPWSHAKTILDFINRNQIESDSDDGNRVSKNSNPNLDTESATLIETGRESPETISSESGSDHSEPSTAGTNGMPFPVTSAQQTPDGLRIPSRNKATPTDPPSQPTSSKSSKTSNIERGTRETIIRKTTKSADLEFIIEELDF